MLSQLTISVKVDGKIVFRPTLILRVLAGSVATTLTDKNMTLTNDNDLQTRQRVNPRLDPQKLKDYFDKKLKTFLLQQLEALLKNKNLAPLYTLEKARFSIV